MLIERLITFFSAKHPERFEAIGRNVLTEFRPVKLRSRYHPKKSAASECPEGLPRLSPLKEGQTDLRLSMCLRAS
jgi:hypothetical protein